MADTFLAGALGRQTAHEFVREHLRRAILSGAAPGGTRLVQSDVAAQLGVSTTPVREALRDLVTEGLVEFDPHRGAIVHQPNLEEVLELYSLREVVEPLVLQFAYKRGAPESLARASAIQAVLDQTRDATEWAELNWQFHAALIAHASPRLRSIVKTLQDASALYVARAVNVDSDRIANGNAEHHRILDALEAGQLDAAASHLRSHVSATLRGILSYSAEGAAPAGNGQPGPSRPGGQARRPLSATALTGLAQPSPPATDPTRRRAGRAGRDGTGATADQSPSPPARRAGRRAGSRPSDR